MTISSWEAALDEFSARLSLQRAALGAGEPDSVAAFTPPAVAGQIPNSLLARAEALMQESLALQEDLERRLAAASREVGVVSRFVHATGDSSRGTSKYVDSAL